VHGSYVFLLVFVLEEPVVKVNSKETFVYAAPHKKLAKFKIGFSTDVGRRLREVGEPIEWSNGYVLACDRRGAVRIENILHKLFDEYRLRGGVVADGYTEWFDKKCLSRVKKFIEDNQSLLRYKRIEKLGQHKKEKPVVGSARIAPLLETEERNLLALSRFRQWLNRLTAKQPGEIEAVFRRVYLVDGACTNSAKRLVLEFSNANVTTSCLNHVFQATDESFGPTLSVGYAKQGGAHVVGPYSFDTQAGGPAPAGMTREERDFWGGKSPVPAEQLNLNLKLHPQLVLPIQYDELTEDKIPGINEIKKFFEAYKNETRRLGKT
tara:strand:- start:488 stop:1453 length:966 start_codon:yes stop_codon:yes gene_type:complete